MYMVPYNNIYVNICKCFNRGPQGRLGMPNCAASINKNFIIIGCGKCSIIEQIVKTVYHDEKRHFSAQFLIARPT